MQSHVNPVVAIIGAGPAGLMAAEQVALAGSQVHVFDAMPSVGRKFLLAGKSGMNLSHSENFDQFRLRYRDRSRQLETCLDNFDSKSIRQWARDLGIETFIGSSGRIFPIDMKAAPLLRAWLHRLRAQGVQFHMRHKWIADDNEQMSFVTPDGIVKHRYDAVVFALGGASWKRLGSDGQWAEIFQSLQIGTRTFQPSNCGFIVNWSDYIKEKFAGTPLTNISASLKKNPTETITKLGQFVITERGIEGSLIYALSADLREEIQEKGYADLILDLLPAKSRERVFAELSAARGSRSLSSHLRSKLGLHPVHCALINECLSNEIIRDNYALASCIKALPIRLIQTCPIDEAISTAGGVDFAELNEEFMLLTRPGWFCAGEMLDWEAPTGGYLLSACFATGVAAGRGVNNWLSKTSIGIQENLI
ncbi:TIGR03862 family flavoprotein [Undibacterium sp.]|uniref:TIGR03862 family flavoprotein n=1 Tax=Undibacterium sp. TaxID=1914977 RepID=UPI003753E089